MKWVKKLVKDGIWSFTWNAAKSKNFIFGPIVQVRANGQYFESGILFISAGQSATEERVWGRRRQSEKNQLFICRTHLLLLGLYYHEFLIWIAHHFMFEIFEKPNFYHFQNQIGKMGYFKNFEHKMMVISKNWHLMRFRT